MDPKTNLSVIQFFIYITRDGLNINVNLLKVINKMLNTVKGYLNKTRLNIKFMFLIK